TCFVKLTCPKIYIGATYVPPKNPLTIADLDLITKIGSPLILGGDFNAKHSSWNNHRANANGNTLHQHFRNNTYSINHPNALTHYRANANPSTIDFYLTTSALGFDCSVIDEGNSDHLPVLLIPNNSSPTSVGIDIVTDWTKYNKITNNYNIISHLESASDIDDSISSVTSFMHACVRRASCKVNSSTNRHKRMVADDFLLSLIRLRRRLRSFYQRHCIPQTAKQMCDISATIKRRIKSAPPRLAGATSFIQKS
ncbi:RNA-directed DNA polymerase from mobile element jockey, partial [Habropoda laboriosa]